MPTENQIDPRKGFVPRYLPWLLALAAFSVYCLTLNHWVSLLNLASVERISGWDWRPQLTAPLTFLVTGPFRCLPAVAVPVALNLFSAVCAALTLALLARSVAILPQDRTDDQRKREKSDFSFLTVPSAWMPPVLAVAICGLQLTFWEQATNFSGEMFNLLLFAYVICSLLEYRLDEQEGRLFLATFIYGAGMAENWAMVGFLPFFLMAIIWIRGFAILDLRFLTRMMLCGLTGLLLYFLLPLTATANGKLPLTFWGALKINLMPIHELLGGILYCIQNAGPCVQYITLVLAYFLPLLMMSIRWRASFGDNSQIGSGLAAFILHLANTAFLAIFIWMAFDPPFSPRSLGSVPLLTFYYLGALAIGYYAGYFLLILGNAPVVKRPPRKKPFLQKYGMPVLVCLWVSVTLSVIGLAYRNFPLIRISNDDTLRQFAKLTEENLPRSGGYLLSDDPHRLFLVYAALVQDHRENNYVPLDTSSLTAPSYHHFLHERYPKKWPDLVFTNKMSAINPIGLIQLMAVLSQTNDLYYVHPSFGYYFEAFYLEPHGLVYKMNRLPANMPLPPPLAAGLISENERFWTNDAARSLATVAGAVAPPDPNAPLSVGEYILMRLHISRQPNLNSADLVANFYSRSLDYWGVALQRTGNLGRAATSFENALQFNSDNAVAQINLDFNKKLQSRLAVAMDLSQVSTDQFGKYTTWQDVLNADGPFDDPDYCYVYGFELYHGNLVRQSISQFDRVRELAPDFLPTRLMLAQAYLLCRLPQRAMDILREPLEQPAKFSLNNTNDTMINSLAAAIYFQENDTARGVKMIDTEIAHHPGDSAVLTTAAQIFILRGLFTNAMAIIDLKLKSDPDNPGWLYDKGYSAIQLKDYPTAISALDRVLEIQTNNANALFNRAIANFRNGRLDAAQADYLRLQLVSSNAIPIVYGLGEIARLKNDTNDAIHYYQIYLSRANTNSDEAKTVAARLKALQP